MDTNENAIKIFDKILSLRESIDSTVASLKFGDKVFGVVSLKIFQGFPSEFNLIRVVSWCYALYRETGEVDVKFLTDIRRLKAYDLDPHGRLPKHLKIVPLLRTFFQHNLDLSKSEDRDKQEKCRRWFQEQCGNHEPANNAEWEQCLLSLLVEAQNFLEVLLQCIQHIELDESRDEILREWNFRRSRYHAPYEFDELIQIVAADLGRDTLIAINLRKRFYERWRKYFMEEVEPDYDFQIEARKLIETAILDNPIPPITADDIKDKFDIPPGPKLGKLRERAQTLYRDNPYLTRAGLLEQLQPEVEKLKMSSN